MVFGLGLFEKRKMENFELNGEAAKTLSPLTGENAKELADAIAEVLDSKKGHDIKVIRVEDKTVISEYFVLCTGNSSTQIKALAGEVEFKMEERDIKAEAVEGRWKMAGPIPAEAENMIVKDAADIEAMKAEFTYLGVTPENTYMFIQGHHIMESVVMKVLTPVCNALRREREEEIKRLAEHHIQFRNELTCYERSLLPVDVVLRKHTGFKDSPVYKRLEKDIQEFLKRIK